MARDYTVLNWIFGIIFALAAITSLADSFLSSLCMVGIAALLLPPVRAYVHGKTQWKLPVQLRGVAIVALLLAASQFMSASTQRQTAAEEAEQARLQAEKNAKTQAANAAYFKANRPEIIGKIKQDMASKDYQSAVISAKKYRESQDAELIALYNEADSLYQAQQKAERNKALLAQLKTTPENDYTALRNIYQELNSLDRNNDAYATKLNFYTKKAAEEEQKKALAAERDKLISAQFSQWDGAHHGLERFIKENMNDPDSYDHVRTVYWDKGDYLIVKTTFRGNNAFGGKVLNSVKAEVSLDGKVLRVLKTN